MPWITKTAEDNLDLFRYTGGFVRHDIPCLDVQGDRIYQHLYLKMNMIAQRPLPEEFLLEAGDDFKLIEKAKARLNANVNG